MRCSTRASSLHEAASGFLPERTTLGRTWCWTQAVKNQRVVVVVGVHYNRSHFVVAFVSAFWLSCSCSSSCRSGCGCGCCCDCVWYLFFSLSRPSVLYGNAQWQGVYNMLFQEIWLPCRADQIHWRELFLMVMIDSVVLQATFSFTVWVWVFEELYVFRLSLWIIWNSNPVGSGHWASKTDLGPTLSVGKYT